MKTTFTYDKYVDYAEMTAYLKQLQEAHPSLMKLSSICETEEGKQVWVVELTNTQSGDFADKPAYYVDGNHHAGELMGSMACLHFIDYMLTNHSESHEIQDLLNHKTLYVIPKISPDGADTYMHTPNSLRSVNRDYPKKELEDGLHPCDIDGDGVIRLMRIKSPYGIWKVSPTDDRLFVKRQPDDIEGPFYFVYPEGDIQNYDGINIKLAASNWGLDFNRNYPFGWFSEYRQPGAGKYPLSNPENKAVADFVIEHQNIGTAATLHTSGGMIVYPPGVHPEKEASEFDMRLYKEIGNMGTEETGYPCYNIFDAFLTDTVNYSSGAFDDWCYFTQGIPTYTIEFWDLLKQCGIEHVYPTKRPKDEKTLAQYYQKQVAWMDQQAAEPDKFKNWTKWQHPTLGEVEIGGVNFKYTEQNCPPHFLKEEIEKNTKFMIRHANTLPKLVVESIAYRPLSQQLYEVNLIIGNHGYLPTYICEQAKVAKVDHPITVECLGADDFMGGSSIQQIGHLEGFSGVTGTYGYSGIKTEVLGAQQKKVTFYVKANKETTLIFKITSQKCGKLITSLTLEK
ncbi:MAG TPA: zinc carboxypeptidase [Firmicutes bacterium]|nr:zinc carboxypeptidase [Bacillota bacterium]